MRRIVLISTVSIIILVLSIVAAIMFQHFQTGKYIAVRFSNTQKVTLVDFKTSRQIGPVELSGDKIYIQKDRRYQIEYIGSDGYKSGNIDIDNSKNEVVVKPYYSDKKLDSMLDTAKIKSIHSAIKKYYPNVEKNYTIQKGKLHHYGEWYTATLVYKKAYSFDSDILRIILKETPTGWEVAGTPNITLDRFTNPTIPVDILRQVNNF